MLFARLFGLRAPKNNGASVGESDEVTTLRAQVNMLMARADYLEAKLSAALGDLDRRGEPSREER